MLKTTEFYRSGALEVARIRATGTAEFARHTHAEYVISATLSGSEDVWLDGKTFSSPAGTATVYNPYAIQASAFHPSAGDTEFISLYLEPQLLADIASANGWTSRASAQEVNQGVFADASLQQRIVDVYLAARAISADRHGLTDTLEYDTALTELAAALLANGHSHGSQARIERLSAHRLDGVRTYMREQLDTPVKLDDLATIADISKFHLIRAFKDAFGMSPGKYHMQLRLIEARRLLRAGATIADVAFTLGFYDQSHFINAFRKALGVSPLRFATPRRPE
ncbi:AraC-like DNA-binding protein [Paraburkholderia bannensis]|uniref:AraC-like DNA-binding protein n=1 Tax=Paraburkholderia bannensis TaxID=765414 RepID=A0A7W9WRR1_9BURK|nr:MULTISPECIES: AraC family transcriptional regulator [Paraburkholderia]MBB3258457.1 AraC-like DNA-binding protein [Paraburkholderia sp. WP4_3_2]MBB6103470.1 AraC-like DNA-binding protein [Paraburkholderia bannensis]